mgnify:CR=1 FL=1
MPTTRVTNSLFDIQITMTSPDRVPITVMVQSLLSLLPQVIQQLVKACQTQWLETDLGPYGTTGLLFGDESVHCPRCGGSNANRKCWKDRTWTVPILGELEVPLRWVRCQDCGRHWTPYKERLGIEDDVQYSPEVMIKHIGEAIDTTYQRVSEQMSDSPSPMTIWRWLLDTETDAPSSSAVNGTVCLDATKVPKHKEQGQWWVTVAQGITSTDDGWDRRSLAGTMGHETDIKDPLRQYDVQRLMHDGQLNVDELCDQEGRHECRNRASRPERRVILSE